MMPYEYGGWPNPPGTKPLSEAKSDSSGQFRLGPVEPAYRMLFDLQIEAEGFAPQYVPSGRFSIFPEHDCDLGRICMFRGRVITGQVLDVDGKPRAGAKVSVEVGRLFCGYVVSSIGPSRIVVTDAEGRFRTPLLPVGDAGFTVHEPERTVAYRALLMQRPEGVEDLKEPIRLENDAPVAGSVMNERGRPIQGATIYAGEGYTATTDAKGDFVLRGFRRNPNFNVRVDKQGYVFVERAVQVSEQGFTTQDVNSDGTKLVGPIKDLTVVMMEAAWIEGRAVDAVTGEPVHLDRVVLCTFDRKTNGEIVRGGCKVSNFEQPEMGRFRVPYNFPNEYTLTFSAAGYHDTEFITPLVTRLKPITGIIVKLAKNKPGTKPEMQKQHIFGSVTRDGRPIKEGWVGLWKLRKPANAVNAHIVRGRSTTSDPAVYLSVRIHDGAYSIEVPFQDEGWYIVIEEPGAPITQVGPLSIAANEEKKLDIACTNGGTISGRVDNVHESWKGQLWVVAFGPTSVLAETRVDADGRFAFKQLPPGKCGLKVGHDGCELSDHPELSRIKDIMDVPKEDWTQIDDPWQTATVVHIEPGHDVADVQLHVRE